MTTLYKLGQTLRGRLSTYTLTKEIYNTVWLASNNGGEIVVIKGVRHSRIKNERDVLQKFQNQTPIRPLVDEILEPIDPPGIVLRYLDSDLLAASTSKTLNRSEIKHVARIVLKALTVIHEDGYVHTDIKPNNVLCNYRRDEDVQQDGSIIRFSEVLLADFGSCVPSSSNYAQQGELIGTSIFRSPEASLKLPWGPSTDIWSFGALVISLFFGNYHIFSPRVSVDDPEHDRIVLERIHMFFGPFPLTYKTLADSKTLNYLAEIMNNVPQRKPFGMIKDKEFEPEDKTFLLEIMKLDPRDRPTVKELLLHKWFEGNGENWR
ncbi:hypothetical protein EG328_007130 [Venturia inaequalis]|uniref:Protein kinase domain-containing protein n=1 Tax=Venturia inaequalis TaxID=5025 RepID=A0A8H3UG57_VENIN|nr:hypothetical protein EG328_007130 [Venturia inaequalis]